MHSSLTSSIQLAHPNNYMVGRGRYKICKITPHHMAGKLTGSQCASLFQNPNRLASATYCIGYDGDIVCNVDEVNRPYTSSNYVNDCQAITIEVSNDQVGGNWHVSDKSWNSLVNLCVDICKRYGFRLNYTGNANGSLTMHKMFVNTDCPGPYLESRMAELAKEVNAKLDGNVAPAPQPNTPNQILEIGSKVIFDGNFRVEKYSASYGSLGQAVYNSVIGGWLPCSLDPMYEDSAKDGAKDNYFATTNATFNIAGTYTVGNLRKVNGDWQCYLNELQCWVRTMAVTEVQNG